MWPKHLSPDPAKKSYLCPHGNQNHRRQIQGRPHKQPPRNLHGQRPSEGNAAQLAGHRRGLDAPGAGLLWRCREELQRVPGVLPRLRGVPRDGDRASLGQRLSEIPGLPLLVLPGRAGLRRYGRSHHGQYPQGPQAQRAGDADLFGQCVPFPDAGVHGAGHGGSLSVLPRDGGGDVQDRCGHRARPARVQV